MFAYSVAHSAGIAMNLGTRDGHNIPTRSKSDVVGGEEDRVQRLERMINDHATKSSGETTIRLSTKDG